MKNRTFNRLRISFIFLLIAGFPFFGKSQGKPKLFFKEGDTLRIESNSTISPEATVTIVVPKDKDTTNKDDIPKQDTLKGGKIVIELDKQNSSIEWSKVKLPITNEFTLDALTEKHEFPYALTVPRHAKDDKFLNLILHAKDSSGNEIKDLSKKITVYIKTLSADTLRSSRLYEFWFLAGTNFDLFDGVKAQEFFFRANTLFRISDKFLGQIAFYKNRYYTVDTTSGTLPFTTVKRPSLGDSLYTLTAANYRRTTRQTIDPLALQFDLLYKLTSDSVSNFFATVGFDISTTSVTIKNDYNYSDTSLFLRTSKPDTVKGYNNFGTTAFPESISYKRPTYNFNVGFMWILNESEVNIKAQLTAGLSNYTNLLSFYQSKGAGIIYNFEPKKNIAYIQMRMFATYKPLGISFGLESFIRKNEVPAFNFTLSKAFDIRGFIRNFTPVSGLKL